MLLYLTPLELYPNLASFLYFMSFKFQFCIVKGIDQVQYRLMQKALFSVKLVMALVTFSSTHVTYGVKYTVSLIA